MAQLIKATMNRSQPPHPCKRKKEKLYPRLGWCRDRRMPGACWLVTTLINELPVEKKTDKVLVRWISGEGTCSQI